MIRRQYAHDKPRNPAVPTRLFDHGKGSKYSPHQGKRETGRRVAQRRKSTLE